MLNSCIINIEYPQPRVRGVSYAERTVGEVFDCRKKREAPHSLKLDTRPQKASRFFFINASSPMQPPVASSTGPTTFLCRVVACLIFYHVIMSVENFGPLPLSPAVAAVARRRLVAKWKVVIEPSISTNGNFIQLQVELLRHAKMQCWGFNHNLRVVKRFNLGGGEGRWLILLLNFQCSPCTKDERRKNAKHGRGFSSEDVRTAILQ